MNRLNYEQSKLRMSTLSRSIGISAIVASVILPEMIFVSFGLGFLAILLAFLSKGYDHNFNKYAKIGTILGSIALVISLAIGAYSVHTLISNPEALNEAINSANAMYGEEYKEIYGKDVNELFNEMFGDALNVQ